MTFPQGFRLAPMDCKHFRKHHLAYLDDTLPGELMSQAQRHVLECDCCAAHDTLVRRSLMVAQSLPTIEPSAAFQSRLRERLAECRAERDGSLALGVRYAPAGSSQAAHAGRTVSPARTMLAMAASAVIGAVAFQAVRDETVPTLAMQPVMAMPPAMVASPYDSPYNAYNASYNANYISPALMRAMATGNPVWPAALIVEQAPVGFVNTDYRFAEMR